jgi:hypothetical protein
LVADRMIELLRDLLLESPIPSPNWMPTRSQRLGDAAITLRRRFAKGGRLPPVRQGLRVSDITSTHLPGIGARYIPGATIEAEMEAEITTINPPTVQGWAWLLTIPAALAVIAGLGALSRRDWAGGSALLFGGPAAWAVIVWVWGCFQHEVVLGDAGVAVRSWSQARLDRGGRVLGPPSELQATTADRRLELAGPGSKARVHLWLWPPSAIADLHDKLQAWGVGGDEFASRDRHHHHHERHHRQGRIASG